MRRDRIPDFDTADGCADRVDAADDLVPGDQRQQVRVRAQTAIDHLEVGGADA